MNKTFRLLLANTVLIAAGAPLWPPLRPRKSS